MTDRILMSVGFYIEGPRREDAIREHMAWIQRHGSLRAAIANDRRELDFSESPIQRFVEAQQLQLVPRKRRKQ